MALSPSFPTTRRFLRGYTSPELQRPHTSKGELLV